MSSYYEKMLATGEVKCIDEEIPFDVPVGWEWCRLGELISYQNGYAYTSSELNKECKGMPVIKSGNLMTYEVVLKPNNDYVEKPSTKMLTSVINKGDLLMCLSSQSDNPEPLGKTAIYKANTPALLNQRVLKMRPWLAEMLEYMYYVINSEYFHYTVSHQGGGSAQANLKLGHVLSMLVPLAPLEEEVRIVDKITAIMPLVLQYETTFLKQEKLNIEINNRLKSSILQEAIQGKLVPQIAEEGSAQDLLEQIKEEKRRLVREGKLKKSALNDSVIFRGDDNKYWEKSTECMECIDDKIPFEIPSTWCWVRHNQLFEISGGSQPPKSQFVDSPKSGYIRLYQIRDYGSNPMPVYIPQEKANKITKEGDIILARYGGSLGKVFWAKDGAYNVAMAKVIPLFDSEFVNKQYLFLFYQSSIYQYLVKDHSRSAQAGFNKDDLKDLFFPLPPLEEQSRIVEIYKSVTSIMSR